MKCDVRVIISARKSLLFTLDRKAYVPEKKGYKKGLKPCDLVTCLSPYSLAIKKSTNVSPTSLN